jgi:hypothetical protein
MQSNLIDNDDDFEFSEPEEIYGNHGCLISGSVVLLYLVTILYYIFNKGI